MQPVNYNHSTCPKCSATLTSDSKKCSSCGAVRFHLPLPLLFSSPFLSYCRPKYSL
ncbi:hypothetical protein V8C34DRAFT_298576 [Trichoderma compactum]